MVCWRKGHSLVLTHTASHTLSLFPLLHPDSCLNPPRLSLFLVLSLPLSLSLTDSVSLSRSLRVMTAARQCVRKLECHVLTGVRRMLTGQTQGTDGSVTCPRSSGMPLLGTLDLKPNTFSPAFRISPLSLLCFCLTSLSPTSFSLLFPSLLCLPCFSLFSVYHSFPSHCTGGHTASCNGYLCLNTLPPKLSLLHIRLYIFTSPFLFPLYWFGVTSEKKTCAKLLLSPEVLPQTALSAEM